MSGSSSIEQKLENFKSFVKEISQNQEIIQEYQEISWFKMKALAYVLLIPQRDNLPEIVKEMQKRLQFNDEHLPKFQRYLEFFVEYLTGSESEPSQRSQMSYEEQLEAVMASLST